MKVKVMMSHTFVYFFHISYIFPHTFMFTKSFFHGRHGMVRLINILCGENLIG